MPDSSRRPTSLRKQSKWQSARADVELQRADKETVDEAKADGANSEQVAGYVASTAWLADENSPYGFADDDGTLKQLENQEWRRIFSLRKRRRFVPARRDGAHSVDHTPQLTGPGKPLQTAKGGSTWFMQCLFAIGLVAAGYYANHTSGSLAAEARGVYESAFSSDYSAQVLPTLVTFWSKHKITWPTLTMFGAVSLHTPLAGKIVADYSASLPEMVLQGVANEPVLAAGSGTVDGVTVQNGGTKITINHGSFGITTYVAPMTPAVTLHEYVSSGQVIGRLTSRSTHPTLTFALMQNGQPVNPHDYLQFPGQGV